MLYSMKHRALAAHQILQVIPELPNYLILNYYTLRKYSYSHQKNYANLCRLPFSTFFASKRMSSMNATPSCERYFAHKRSTAS